MLCVRCGHNNPDNARHCSKCSAMLPRMAPSGGSADGLSVSEGAHYLKPTRRYITQDMGTLVAHLEEYLYNGGDFDPIPDAIEVIQDHLTRYEANALIDMLNYLEQAKAETPSDEFPNQMQFLIQKGLRLTRDGLELLRQGVRTRRPETLVEGTTKLQEGYDHLGFSLELGEERAEVFRQEINRRNMQEAQEAQQGGRPQRSAPRADGGNTAVAQAEEEEEEAREPDPDVA